MRKKINCSTTTSACIPKIGIQAKIDKSMKKYLRTMLLLAAAIVSASMFVSCGDDETEDLNPGQKEDPADKVEMGYYDLDFPSLMVLEWPDSKEEIEKQYDAYKKRIVDALQYEEDKKYKWSEIVADKERLQKVFDGFGDFEYEVRNCGNKFPYAGQSITFKARKQGAANPDIIFGERKLKCKLNAPENTTCQLVVTLTTVDAVPTANEYCAKLKDLFTDALKDVFKEEYDKVVVSGNIPRTNYYNLYNHTGDAEELKNRVTEACGLVKIPEIPEEVLKDVQAHTPAIFDLFSVTIEAYDPQSGAPHRGKALFGYDYEVLKD